MTAALRERGVAAADIQTSDLNISPNYDGNSQVPAGYGVSESLTATLNNLSVAGSQIEAAVHAGGNAVTVDNVSLNLTDTGSLLAAASANAVKDARAKAAQFAQRAERAARAGDQHHARDQPRRSCSAPNATAAKARSVPISPGSQQVSVSITVVYAA